MRTIREHGEACPVNAQVRPRVKAVVGSGALIAKDLTKRVSCVLVLFVDAPADIDDLAMLAEFAQLAMARARAAAARAEAVEAEGGDPGAHQLAFDRMGRAMRLALVLRRRFAGEARTEAAERVQVRKERLRAALTPAICAHAHTVERRRLEWALAQRLETEAEALADVPLDVGLASLGKALGLPAFVSLDAEPDAAAEPQDRPSPPAAPVAAPMQGLAALLTPELIACARQVAAEVPRAATGPP